MRLSALWLCALLSAAAVPARAQRAVVASVAPLAELGALLRTALPPGTVLAPELPLSPAGTLPSVQPTLPVFDTAKLEVLLQRSEPLRAAQTPSAAAALTPQAASLSVLSAVNAVFQDLSPDELRAMPVAELDHLAGLVFDQLRPGPAAAPAAVAVLARARLRRLDAMSGQPMKETALNPDPGPYEFDLRNVSGVPPAVRRLSEDEGSVTFRHYTSEEGLRAILAAGSLINGHTPYMLRIGRMVWKTFKDLSGVFLTLPEVGGGDVGVAKSPAYVDLKVPKGLPILEIEPGRIYLIPLPGRVRRDLRERFLSWLRGEPVPPAEARELEKLGQEGGPGPALSVPIEIVGHSPLL
ncbi:MAG TPA: hypothetical protein DD417_14125 [Elusimicrobia bacterium]|nr:hypothetical protein [Elusimicrobiota bacterium]